MDKSASTHKESKNGGKSVKLLSLDKKNLKKHIKKVETTTTKHARKFIVKRIGNVKESRRYIVAWLLVASLLIAGIGVHFFVIDKQYTERASTAGGTYAEGVVGKLETLNPLYISSSAEGAASKLLFSSLYGYDSSGALHPDLAESMKMEDGGRRYTVRMRQGVKWHDGAPLTAKDVDFTVKLIKNPDIRARTSLQASWQDVAVQVIDNYTIEFRLSPYAAFPHALTFAILPQHIVSQIPVSSLRESSYSKSPVGSGPFTYRLLQSSQSGDMHRTLHLVANKNYYEKTPFVDRMELHVYQKTDQLVQAIRSNEVTGAIGLDEVQASAVKMSGYNRFDIPLNSGIYTLMNTDQAILKDRIVRQAIQRTIDTEAIRKEVSPNAPVLNLPFLPSQVRGSERIKVPKVDIAEANKLLDTTKWKLQGEYRKQKDTELRLQITVLKNEQYEKIAHMMVEQLKAIGIRASVQVIDTEVVASGFVQDILQPRNYDILLYELPIGADPDVFAYWHSSQRGLNGYNFTNYANDTVDVALVSARDQTDSSRRDSKYIAFAKQWLADAPAIALYQQVAPYFVNKNAQSVDSSMRFVSIVDRYSGVNNWMVSKAQFLKTP